MFAPAFARVKAVDFPIPRAAPVTTAFLPFKSIIILSYSGSLRLKYFGQTEGQGSFPTEMSIEQNVRSGRVE
ncbi:hypothetical protein CH375_16050 [Leptospira ellisii]|uniref:Uncharacterized protein n=1 Tax=Leptospira ellisii TaxID=2023197 RepID=A0A2N0B8L6_9LEPT|nr:hypothetical protein CH379_10610 [Leptospira ellisii]PKA03594.1 hypothetical protein CH375_16050 [Leptospira ellisii]